MGLTVQKKFFERREQVFEDLAQTGHWPTTFVSGASPELPLHWHDLDVSGYVIEGTTYLVDEAGQHHALEPGDKLNIPRGTLHAEGAVVGEVAQSAIDGLLFMCGPLYWLIVLVSIGFMTMYQLSESRHAEILKALRVRRGS